MNRLFIINIYQISLYFLFFIFKLIKKYIQIIFKNINKLMQGDKKFIQGYDGEPIEFPPEFDEICEQFQNANPEEPLKFINVSSNTLQVIHNFYSAHDWKEPEPCQLPLETNNLKKEIGEISYEIMKDYEGNANMEKLVPLLEASVEMKLKGFEDVCMATAAIEFIFDDPETGAAEYQKKYNIQITEEQEQLYKEEFEQMYAQNAEDARKNFENMYAELEKDL